MGNESHCMIGNHAIPIITEAYLKGIRDFDVEKAYEAMKETSLSQGNGLGLFRTYNYIPCDLEKESVSKTLEYAYDDWCMAQMAKALNKEDDYLYFMEASKNYKNVFDSSTGFMRAKLSDGKWKTPFSPFASIHRDDDYTEGNAWQYSWFVPHDVEGLIALHGGKAAFANKLDSLFTLPSTIEGDNVSPDISGLIGSTPKGTNPLTTWLTCSITRIRPTKHNITWIKSDGNSTRIVPTDFVAMKIAGKCLHGMFSLPWVSIP